MPDFSQIMKQAQEMQAKLLEQQDKLAETEVTGTSGGGMVKITMTCQHNVKKIELDPVVINPEDVTILEDLLTAAFNDAATKAQEKASSGLNGILPSGLNLPF